MNVKLTALSAGALFFIGQITFAQTKKDTATKEKQIEEVVVVAFGKQKKEEIAGAVTTLKTEAIKDLQNGNVLQGLAGKVAGVQVINSGQPGSGTSIRMRGVGSINASSQPLIVLDGIPYNGNMNSIPSQDIESLTFLKDASSNALYGSRGANGVIMVTTKKAKRKGIQVEFDTKIGVNTRAIKDYDVITSPEDYYKAYYDRLRVGAYRGASGSTTFPAMTMQQAHQTAADNLDELGYNNYNVPFNQLITNGVFNPNAVLQYQDFWEKELFKSSIRTEHSLGITSSNDVSKTFFSLNYLKDNGYSLRSGFTRLSTRLNTDYKIGEKIKVGTNLSYSNTDLETGSRGTGSNYSNLFNFSRGIAPIYPVYVRDAQNNIIYDAEGNKVYDFGTGDFLGQTRTYAALQNPAGSLILDKFNDVTDNFSTRTFASIDLLKDLNFTYNFSYDLNNRNYYRFANPLSGDAASANGRLTRGVDRFSTIGNQQLLTYNKTFGNHKFDILLGHETNTFKEDYMEGQKTEFLLPDVPVLNYGTKFQYLNGGEFDYKVQGLFSRINYSNNNKYFINASIRRDGSSIFNPESRWGTFYGIGGAWMISKENFLSKVKSLSSLKLKASYGLQGNDNLLLPDGTTRIYYAYSNLNDVQNGGDGTPSTTPTFIGNKDLKWETSINLNTGFELQAFNNRFSLEAEYFERKVSDMLFYLPLPPSNAGSLVKPANIGDMENKGIEVAISGDIIQSDDFNWSIDANGTHYKNLITKLPEAQRQNGIINGLFNLKEGYSRFDYFMYEYAGVDEKTGDALWYKNTKDANGNVIEGNRETTAVIGQANQVFIGKSAIPKIYGGFGTDLKYKNVSLRVGFAYQFGGWGYDSIYQNLMSSSGDIGSNYHKDVFNSWTPENTTAGIPRVDRTNVNQSATSSFYLIKSDYISIQDVTIGWEFGKSFLDTFKINYARIYLTGNNLALWSKRQGYDPRLALTGQSNVGAYSTLKSTSLGINFKF